MNDESVMLRPTAYGRVFMGGVVALLPLCLPLIMARLTVEWGWSEQSVWFYGVGVWLLSLFILFFWFPTSFEFTTEGVYRNYVLRVGDKVFINRRSKLLTWSDVVSVDVGDMAWTRSSETVEVAHRTGSFLFNRTFGNFDRALLLVERRVPGKLTAEAQRWARASAKVVERQEDQIAEPSS
ncbi:MAG: hypothetical protein ABJF88_03915 [Rhodothermales bacterium]